MENVIHKLDEFHNLPWDKLDPEKIGAEWSISRGGYGFDDSTWSLHYFSDSIDFNNLNMEIWELPPALGKIIDLEKILAANEVRYEIRSTLGL